MEEDLKLITQFKAGDNEGFEKLVIKYRSAAIDFSKNFVQDYHIAEDIAQDSFSDIYVYKERYDEKYKFKTYLFTIIKNKSVDYIRRNHVILVDDTFDSIVEEGTEDIILRNELRKMVNEKVNELKDDYKTVIHLIDFEEFSYKDAAKIMGKNLVQTKILIYRARQKLKTLLKNEEV